MEPKVSVIMAVCNGEDYIEKCVESILGQTFADFEFIIIDDGSTDSTPNLLNHYNDPRLKILRQENQGLTRSLKTAAQIARGSFIARMDADDVSLPDRLEEQVRFMDAHPDYVLCGSRFQESESGQPQRIPYIQSDEEIRKKASCFNPFCHSTTLFRRDAYEKSGGYDTRIRYGQDFDLWIRLLGQGKAFNLDKVLVTARFHPGSITGRNEKRQLISALKTRRKAYLQFGGNVFATLYHLMRSILVLILPGSLRSRLRCERRS